MTGEGPPPQATQILDYFVRNPQATDSIEGIARWRLLDEAIHRDVGEVAEALEWLVAEGFVVRESASGGFPVFSLNQRNAADAQRLLTKAVRRPAGTPS